MNSDSNLLKQQLFEEFLCYSASGALVSYSISPVYFAFPIGAGNVGYFDPDLPSIFI